jgi:hypothetical protein
MKATLRAMSNTARRLGDKINFITPTRHSSSAANSCGLLGCRLQPSISCIRQRSALGPQMPGNGGALRIETQTARALTVGGNAIVSDV